MHIEQLFTMIEKTILRELVEKPEKIRNLKFDVISQILSEAKDLFKKENLLLKFKVKDSETVYVIGDIHGNLNSLTKIIKNINENNPKLVISLGDLVDRGPKQLECLIMILCLKILEPHKYFILKGNHEDLEINALYGFFKEFVDSFDNTMFYSKDNAKFRRIVEIYEQLPVCALINGDILCLHGGIPEDVKILDKLENLKNKDLNDSIKKEIYQITWNDPIEDPNVSGFTDNIRGEKIKRFGYDAFQKFMDYNKLKFVIRSHHCFPEGYSWFFNKKLLSIFSSSNYKNDLEPNPATYAVIQNQEIKVKFI